jgi:sulfane dehydrogenase subunit SoxC
LSDSTLPSQRPGAIQKAPESFLTPADLANLSVKSSVTLGTHSAQSRRSFVSQAFQRALGASAIASSLPAGVLAQSAGDPNILKLPAHSTGLGKAVATEGYGKPSQFERNIQRRQSPGLTQTNQASVSFTPLQSLFGIVTPSGLHFERHHQGWWDIDPTKHRLMINGSDPSMIKTPMVYTLDEIMRLPSQSRFHFIECGANTGMEWGNVAVPTVQYTHGMLSCCEFTGVPLILLLEQAGINLKNAKFILAEAAEGSGMTRTIPLNLVLSGQVLVAYGQNGEMLRPENGYPLRLVVPGVQGVSWVKYLRRIEVGDAPYATKDETLHYVDLMPDGQHRQYSHVQECKSVVTTPSGGQVLLEKGFQTITGLAWSGRGKIKGVDVSVDGGRNWHSAQLQTPVMDKCLTRFQSNWQWDGQPALIQSRAIDSTGYVQPTYAQLRQVRGTRSIYHNNAIQTWLVQADGEVKNVQV